LARFAILPVLLGTAATMLIASTASAQLYTSGTFSNLTNWDASRWNTSNAAPFTSGWVSGSATSFGTSPGGTTLYSFNNLTGGSGTTTLGNLTTTTSNTVAITNQLASSAKSLNFLNTGTITTAANSFVNFGFSSIAGTNSIRKEGAGTLALVGGGTSGATYTGGLTINGGTVIATSTNALGNGTVTIASGGGTIGSGRPSSAGTDTLKDFSTRVTSLALNGDLTLGASGTLAFNSSAASMTFGNVALGGIGDRTLTIGSSGTQTISGVISGANVLKLESTGTGASGLLVLSGTNTYSGGTRIGDVVLQASGAGTVNVLGTGAVSLTGATASTLRLTEGLTLSNAFDIGNTTGVKTISSSGNATISGPVATAETTASQFILGAVSSKTLTVSGDITGAGGLQVGGTGLDGTVLLTGSNSFTGGVVVDTGTLKLGSANAIPTGVGSTQTVNLSSNGTLDLNSFSTTLKQVNGSAGTILSTGAGISTLTLGAGDTSSTLSATFGDGNANLNLVKIGSGTLTVGNIATTGTTSVNAGTLVLTGQGNAGNVAVNAGGTLKGSDSLAGDLTVNGAGSTLDLAGVGGTPGSMVANAITLGSTAATGMEIFDGATYSSVLANNIAYGGILNLNYDAPASVAIGTGFSLFTGVTTGNFASITTSGTGEFSAVTFKYNIPAGEWYSTNPTGVDKYLVFIPSTGQLVIVPEPSTWAMALASVGFAGWMARRKKLASKKQKQLAA